MGHFQARLVAWRCWRYSFCTARRPTSATFVGGHLTKKSELGGYGQFCPVAMAAEIVCSRWTALCHKHPIVSRFGENIQSQLICELTRINISGRIVTDASDCSVLPFHAPGRIYRFKRLTVARVRSHQRASLRHRSLKPLSSHGSQHRAFGQNICVRRVSVDRATVSTFTKGSSADSPALF